MWQVIIALAFILIAALGLKAGTEAFKNKEKFYKKEIYARFMADGKLDRQEIRAMLKKLPDSPQRMISMGAMCYEAILIIKTTEIEYICPNCGEKTIYTYSDKNNTIKKSKSKGKKNKILVEYGFFHLAAQIEEYRRVVRQIKGIEVTLDEKQLCIHCLPGIKNPNLQLIIKFPGEGTVHHTGDIGMFQIKLLVDFTTGKISHKTDQDEEFLMTEYIPQIKELLGIED